MRLRRQPQVRYEGSMLLADGRWYLRFYRREVNDQRTPIPAVDLFGTGKKLEEQLRAAGMPVGEVVFVSGRLLVLPVGPRRPEAAERRLLKRVLQKHYGRHHNTPVRWGD